MCKNQTAVSLNSTESEIISLWTLDWDWLVSLLWNYGIELFLFLGMFLVFQIERGNLWMGKTSLMRKSMWWKTLILFLQISNPRAKKFYCMCLKTMKQWSRWSLKEGVLQWDMFPEPTELLLIGYSFESISTPKIQIKYSDTKNPTRRLEPRWISHVMSGIICWACLTLPISVLQFS